MPYRFLPEPFHPDNVLHTVGSARQARFGFGGVLKILVWNIYKGRHNRWQNDFLGLTQDKHIVMLQESVINTKYDPIFQSPDKFEWVMARAYQNLTNGMATGVKTGSCVPSIERRFFSSPDREPFFNTSKMLLATTYDIEGGQPLLVINIHAINFVSFRKYGRQAAQIIEALDEHDGPVILAGDFNTWNIARLRQLNVIAEMLGLESVPLEKRARLSHFNRTLDHLFYKGLTLKSAKLRYDIRTSDHYPIEAEFIL